MEHDREAFPRDVIGDETTQPLPLAYSLARSQSARPDMVFERLAETLEVSPASLELLLSELFFFHDTSAATLTEAQVWNMRGGLLELVDGVLPKPLRERARSRLQLLLLNVAPSS